MSEIPKYIEIENYIKSNIEDGTYQPNKQIPSERKLSTMFGVSRMTARQAINDLVNEGFLYKQMGSGTYVTGSKVQKGVQGFTSFTEDMKMQGLTPISKVRNFDIVEASDIIAERLGIEPFTKVYRIERIRYAENDVMAYEVIYQACSIIGEITTEIAEKSIFSFVESHGLKISYSNQIIEAISADENQSKYLEIKKGDPILLIRNTTFLNDGKILQYAKSFYRADKFRFVSTINRK